MDKTQTEMFSDRSAQITTMEPLYQKHSKTSTACAKSLDRQKLGEKAKLVLGLLSGAGMTDEEIQENLGMDGNSERPLRVQLVRKGLVVDSGETRKTRAGKAATVWVAV